MTIGIVSTLAMMFATDLNINILTLCGIVFMATMPPVLNFTLHELRISRNNNRKRAVTGFLLGIPLGLAIHFFLTHQHWVGMAIIGWYVLLEIAVVVTLMRFNAIEDYVKEYEDGVFKK